MADRSELEPQLNASEVALETAANRVTTVNTAEELLDIAYNAMLRATGDNDVQKAA